MKLFSREAGQTQLFDVTLPESALALREDVRKFLAQELAHKTFEPQCDAWIAGFDPQFSRKLGARGWLGMTYPRQYGGQERSLLDRFVVTEELLAAGAPVAAHWIADRQTGPLILRYGTAGQKDRFLPAIARGECYFGIGMSEPQAGSDLAAIQTSARKVDDGWLLQGRKIWTSWAHRVNCVLVLCRTSPVEQNRHQGMSQFIVDMSSPGVSTQPIIAIDGEHHFNEVFFDEVFIPDGMVLGEVGRGWQQVMGELAFERSGSERFMSSYPLLVELIRQIGTHPDVRATEAIGRLISKLWTLRRMSLTVANLLYNGIQPEVEAALVKEMGTRFEKEIAEAARTLVSSAPSTQASDRFNFLLAQALLTSPSYTIRGGTNEILRGIIARRLEV